jgi:transcriptional regulator with GAF, ATPase, and Fis domain
LGRGRIAPGEGIEGAVAIRGDSYFSQAAGKDNEVLVCIPLKMRGSVIGLISIHQLLSHKAKLNALDHELLQLLAAQAATALVSSKLYATADRKLKTMEGLMNLLRTR